MRWLWRGGLLALGVYLIGVMALVGVQRVFLYPPHIGDFARCDLSGTQSERISFSGERALFTAGSSGRIIVFYHGNAETACDWRALGRGFAQAGDAVLIVEYPTYATGQLSKPHQLSQEPLFQTVDHVQAWIAERGFQQTLVVGYSLGGALASYHATRQDVARVLLFAPFDRLINVIWDAWIFVPSVMVWDSYDNIAQLSKSTAEVMILHGGADRVVRPARSRALVDILGDRAVIYHVDPALDHAVMQGPMFQNIVRAFLAP